MYVFISMSTYFDTEISSSAAFSGFGTVVRRSEIKSKGQQGKDKQRDIWELIIIALCLYRKSVFICETEIYSIAGIVRMAGR